MLMSTAPPSQGSCVVVVQLRMVPRQAQLLLRATYREWGATLKRLETKLGKGANNKVPKTECRYLAKMTSNNPWGFMPHLIDMVSSSAWLQWG